MDGIDAKPTLRYDLLKDDDHIKIATFNGNLEQLKLGIARIDLDRLNFACIINIADMNNHALCLEYLMNLQATYNAKEAARRKEILEKTPDSYKKHCPSCGPVETRYFNCPRCWGPIYNRRESHTVLDSPLI
jgi:hypothetical protein